MHSHFLSDVDAHTVVGVCLPKLKSAALVDDDGSPAGGESYPSDIGLKMLTLTVSFAMIHILPFV
jgi:hypothetical protein